MYTIQLELEDEMIEKLAPYQDKLLELLELGLQVCKERERQEWRNMQDRLLQTLGASGEVQVPKPYAGEKPYARRIPVSIN